jgi:hypothetical protein
MHNSVAALGSSLGLGEPPRGKAVGRARLGCQMRPMAPSLLCHLFRFQRQLGEIMGS